MIGRQLNGNDLAKILIRRPCDGYYLRWYYNGWHYWFFLPGDITVETKGENYRTIGTRKVKMSSGQLTTSQCEWVRTIMNTIEIYLLTDEGWKNIRVEPGSVPVFNNETGGDEIEITAIIGSRETSITGYGYSPVEPVPEDPYGYDYIYIVVGSDTVVIVLTGEGEVTIDWGDGTTTTVILVDGVPQEITHTYTDGEDQHTITILNPENIDILDLDDPVNEIHDVVIPEEYTDTIIVVVDVDDFTECVVKIGNQLWDCYNYDTEFPGSVVYDNDEANRAIYGGLYKWAHIKASGFAPPGKHVPTAEEWQILIDIISEATGGGTLKEVGLDHWQNPNTGAVDTYSFAARGGGYYVYSAAPYFTALLQNCRYWSQTIDWEEEKKL